MSAFQKPYSSACDENRDPILAVLTELLTAPGTVLEIGSGTGQHAAYFAPRLPHLQWQPTDVAEHLPGIRLWCEEAGAGNLLEPLALDVEGQPWPVPAADEVFSANTAHIMSWAANQALFRGVGAVLKPGGRFCLYGPFNYDGRYTSASNERFDAWLKARDPHSGIRDFADLNRLAAAAGLVLLKDYEMPVNNRILVWQRSA